MNRSANRRLGEVATVQTGYSFRDRLEPTPDGLVPVIQMKDIDRDNVINPAQIARVTIPEIGTHHLLRAGDVIFRSRGESNGAAVVGTEVAKAVLAAPMLLVRCDSELLCPTYLQWYINLPRTQSILSSLAAGTSVKIISKAALEQFLLPVPAIPLQLRIAEIGRLAAVEAQLMIDLAESKRSLMEAMLIQKARSGA